MIVTPKVNGCVEAAAMTNPKSGVAIPRSAGVQHPNDKMVSSEESRHPQK
jgi:hypothetical protein